MWVAGSLILIGARHEFYFVQQSVCGPACPKRIAGGCTTACGTADPERGIDTDIR